MSARQQAVRIKNPVPRTQRQEQREVRKAQFLDALWGVIVVLCTIAAVFVLLGIESPRL